MKEQQEKLSKIKGDLNNTNNQFELIIIYQPLCPTLATPIFSSAQDACIWLDILSECITQ